MLWLRIFSFSSINKHFTSVIKFTFMPMSSMIKMCFASLRTCRNLLVSSFIMSSSFISSCLGNFSFWMCHGFNFYNKLSNFSQRGSLLIAGFLLCGSNCSNLLKISFFNVPFLMPGCTFFKGIDKTTIS